MNSYKSHDVRSTFFAVICTVLFSATCLLSATAPVLAAQPVAHDTPAVAMPLA
jgi:hypothetical protein